MNKKQRETSVSFNANKITLGDRVLEDFTYINLSSSKVSAKIVLYEDKDDQLTEIARSKRESGLWSTITIEQLIESKIASMFKDIDCNMCFTKNSAIYNVETEIGNVCQWCAKSFDPPIELIQLKNLKQYLLRK